MHLEQLRVQKALHALHEKEILLANLAITNLKIAQLGIQSIKLHQ